METPIHLRNPDILPEMLDHTSIISYFSKWYKVNTFIEFGVASQATTSHVIKDCKRYIGVDIADVKDIHPKLEFYKMRTDEFIKNVLPSVGIVDMAFIDANHNSDVVIEDFRGVFKYLINDGIIFLHDTFPIKEEYTKEYFCSDSYKVPDMIKKEFGDRVEMITIPIQPGLTIIRKLGRKLNHHIL